MYYDRKKVSIFTRQQILQRKLLVNEHTRFFFSVERKYPRNLPTFRQLHRACRLESDYFQDFISGPVNVYSEKKWYAYREARHMFDIRCRGYFLLYFVWQRFKSILYYLQDFLRFGGKLNVVSTKSIFNKPATSNIFNIHRSVNSHLKYRSAKSKSVRQYLVSLPEARKFSILYRSASFKT